MTADVVVIGGGIIGSSVTYYLAKAGLDVVLVERSDIADGTSSRCDGNVLAIDKQPGYDSQVTFASQELLAGLEDELGCDFEYRCTGSTLAIENESELEPAKTWVEQQRAAGLPFEFLDYEEIHRQEPFLAPDIVGAVECKSDSTLYTLGLIFGLVEGARRLGARIMSYTTVTGLRQEQGRIVAVQTDRGEILTPRAVIAAGVWSPAIGMMAGIDIPIRPRKGQILVAESGPRVCSRKMMEFGYLMAKFEGMAKRKVEPEMETYGVALVFEPTVSGNFLIGSSREFVGFDTQVSHRVAMLEARRAIRFFPVISDTNVIRTYAGLRPWTPDHLPIISTVDEVPGLYVAAGHEGDGIGLGPITGVLLTQMITAQKPRLPLEPVRFSRFGEKSTTGGEG